MGPARFKGDLGRLAPEGDSRWESQASETGILRDEVVREGPRAWELGEGAGRNEPDLGKGLGEVEGAKDEEPEAPGEGLCGVVRLRGRGFGDEPLGGECRATRSRARKTSSQNLGVEVAVCKLRARRSFVPASGEVGVECLLLDLLAT